MQISLMIPMELNEVQTTASLLKIRPKNEVHKNIKLKQGPTEISQQSMQLFQSPSPRKKRTAADRASPDSTINKDLPLTATQWTASKPTSTDKKEPKTKDPDEKNEGNI